MADEKKAGNVPVVVEGKPVASTDRVAVKKFRLRAGKSHIHGDHTMESGDEVFLTPTQAAAFRDKFEPVDDSDFEEKGPEVHDEFKQKASRRHAQELGVGKINESDESAKAQRDKNTAEVKAAGGVAGAGLSTFDHTAGTLTKDPGPETPGMRVPLPPTPSQPTPKGTGTDKK